jgi:hypothetical protein
MRPRLLHEAARLPPLASDRHLLPAPTSAAPLLPTSAASPTLLPSTCNSTLMPTPLGTASTNSTRRCQRCDKTLPLTDFPFKVKRAKYEGERTTTCRTCSEAKSAHQRATRGRKQDSENIPPRRRTSASPTPKSGEEPDDAVPPGFDGAPTNLSAFLAFLGTPSDEIELEVKVSCPELKGAGGGLRERADALADLVYQQTGYRFKCVIHRSPSQGRTNHRFQVSK